MTLTLNLFSPIYISLLTGLFTREPTDQRASDTVGAWLPWLTNRSWVTDWWEAVTWLALYVRAATESDVSDHRHHRLSPSAASLEKAFAFALAPQRIAFSFSYTRVQERRWSVRVQLHVFIRVLLRAHAPCVKLLNTYERWDRTRLCPRKRRSVWRLHSVLLVYLFFSYNSF